MAGPCRIYPIEGEITDDILYYRRVACDNSNSNSFTVTCRYYRAYLLSCISLIEAFINRHILIYDFNNMANDNIIMLKESRNIAERLELLFTLLTNRDISLLKQSIHWCKFIELKDSRNSIVHSLSPFFGHEIKEIAKIMNNVREGIGGLLEFIILNQGKTPISFIKRLKTAPLITYSENKNQ